MGKIYEPSGKAREYSPLAANFYDGCDHGCRYCYAPSIRKQTREAYSESVKIFKSGLIDFEKSCKERAGNCGQVLLSFMGDPYCKENNSLKITAQALKIAFFNKIPIAILTKGGTRALQDFDIIKRFGDNIKIGSTLTFSDKSMSLQCEPGAATPADRLEMLGFYHGAGIKTFASFEPVIDPIESLKIMEKSLDVVDMYKVGKVNNFQGIDKTIDWAEFLGNVVELLRSKKKPFYIKRDLRLAATGIKLYGNEVLHDEFALGPWV